MKIRILEIVSEPDDRPSYFSLARGREPRYRSDVTLEIDGKTCSMRVYTDDLETHTIQHAVACAAQANMSELPDERAAMHMSYHVLQEAVEFI